MRGGRLELREAWWLLRLGLESARLSENEVEVGLRWGG